MARSTPTYTPAGKYVLGGIISLALLFSDINYQTFSSARGFTQATGIYSQLILGNLFDSLTQFTITFTDKKDLTEANQRLRDELLLMQNKIFLDQKSQSITQELLNARNGAKELNEGIAFPSFQIASFDLKNYLCCSSHTLYLKNPNKLDVASNLPVSNGHTFIGQTSGRDLNLIKVILFSDITHILPIKIKGFHCNASGAGKPLMISCLAAQNSQSSHLKINDLAFTSGMGGIFPNNTLIGRVINLTNNDVDEREILIRLDGDPLEQNYFGILSSL
jgi:cell shape-determining protein MreC